MSIRSSSASNRGLRCDKALTRPGPDCAGLDAESWGRKNRRILCGHRRRPEPTMEKIDKMVMEELPWTALELTGRLEIVGSTGIGAIKGLAPRAVLVRIILCITV